MYLDYLLWTAAIVLTVAGLVGSVVPLLPGPILLFAGLLLGAWIDNFSYVGTGTLIVLGVMTSLAYLCEIAGTAFGAKRYGASRRAVIGVLEQYALICIPFSKRIFKVRIGLNY